jgi:6-pyruvoyltetrahydropterin/6-carboxytetrahydropterin synthase
MSTTNDQRSTTNGPASDYSIRVASADLIFSAAHFITFEGGGCEPLHGHDYRVKAELFGPLGANEYLVDFVLVRETLREIVAELDHCVLLPGEHGSIAVALEGEEYIVRHAGRRWILPRDNCRVLPIANTTTEMFAQYIGQRLIDDLFAKRQLPVTELSIEVGECDGFAAVCRLMVDTKME